MPVVVTRNLYCLLSAIQLAVLAHGHIYGQSTEAPRILTEEQLNEELRSGHRSFVNLVIAERWHGAPLASVNDTPVTFRQCHFVDGVEFLNLRISVPLAFDCCAFGPSPTMGNAPVGKTIRCPLPDFALISLLSDPNRQTTAASDNLIQSCHVSDTIRFRSCSFFWDTRIYDTVFAGLFVCEESFHGRTLRIEKCNFASRFRLSGDVFLKGLLVEKTDFNNSLDVTDSEFTDIFELQNVHISGDLILESSSLKTDSSGTAYQAALRMVDTIVAGELNADHFAFKDDPDERTSRLVLQECTIANIRGINWSDFHRAFESADSTNEAEVLAQLRQSYLQSGQTADAAEVLLAMKANEAKQAGYFTKLIDCVMRYSSGWGTSPWLLMCWFTAIVSLFALIYFIIVVNHVGLRQFRWMILPECLVVSICVTLLQHDPDDIRDLCRNKRALITKLRNVMKGHRIIAALFLMVVAGYVGASLSTS